MTNDPRGPHGSGSADGSAPPRIGHGRYEMSGLLGRGGMADVNRARDTRLGRTVAIKRLRIDLAEDPTFQARFRREAQSAASLNHPSIVAVYDTGEEPPPGRPDMMLPYIVMEYVEGRTLRDILREGRKILPERALEIVASVLGALDYSHRAGIIHRDIKPANVMLTPTGDVKVMDFGIARAIADSSATMTQTAAVVGTAQYLSPEQARGEQVDARSDLYSTGCLLFELLTGRPPFVGDSPVSVAYQHVREEPPLPSSLDPEVSPEIDAIVLKSLAKRVDERYQSAAEMRTDIERALEGRPVLAPMVTGPTSLETQHFIPPPPPEDATRVGTVVEREEEEPRRRRTWLWVLLVLLLAAAAIAAAILVPRLTSDEPPPQSTVPDLKGLTVAQAERRLGDANLELGNTDPGFSKTVDKGDIMRQSIAAGDEVDEGTEVDVVVSQGRKMVVVKNVTDMKLAEATDVLEGLNLKVKPVGESESDERRNEVISTDPAAGESVPIGSEVTVYYSEGYIEVPSVVGRTEERATARLSSLGFRVVPSNVPSDEPAGQVVDQDPNGGSMLPYGDVVTIRVSLGPTETSTPTTPTETTPAETTPTETSPPTSSTTSSPPTGGPSDTATIGSTP